MLPPTAYCLLSTPGIRFRNGVIWAEISNCRPRCTVGTPSGNLLEITCSCPLPTYYVFIYRVVENAYGYFDKGKKRCALLILLILILIILKYILT